MTVSNSFGPFGFNHWTVHDTDGGDDAADEVQRGEKNTLSGGDAGNATLIENSANVNMALAVQNFATGSGVVGVYGRSDGAAGGGIGVAGACDSGWGVAGVATVPTIDPRGFPNTVGSLEPVIGSASMARADLRKASFLAPCRYPIRARAFFVLAMSLAWKGIAMARAPVSLERVLEEKASSEIALLARISGSMDKAWQVCLTLWRSFRVQEFWERATMLAFLV
jgi:hypothetical protein